MAEIFTVEQRGVGKPDYSRKVSSAKQRAGLQLEYNQQIVFLSLTLTDQVLFPYPNPIARPPLASGASIHFIDGSTGVSTPYVVPAGYTLTLVQWEWTNNEDFEMWYYVDGILWGCPGMSPPGDNQGFNMLMLLSTSFIDPEALSPHTFDIVLINNGAGDLEGTFDFLFIMEAIGTPPWPSVKQCRCPFCTHTQSVPTGTTNIICDKCGKLYIVRDYSRIKGF